MEKRGDGERSSERKGECRNYWEVRVGSVVVGEGNETGGMRIMLMIDNVVLS